MTRPKPKPYPGLRARLKPGPQPRKSLLIDIWMPGRYATLLLHREIRMWLMIEYHAEPSQFFGDEQVLLGEPVEYLFQPITTQQVTWLETINPHLLWTVIYQLLISDRPADSLERRTPYREPTDANGISESMKVRGRKMARRVWTETGDDDGILRVGVGFHGLQVKVKIREEDGRRLLGRTHCYRCNAPRCAHVVAALIALQGRSVADEYVPVAGWNRFEPMRATSNGAGARSPMIGKVL